MTSSQEKDVHLVYKKLGETPLECIGRFRIENPEYMDSKITYAGRLDPMAEGLLILLTNEKVNEKQKFLDLTKTYQFEILWGFKTDTLDLLGRVVKKSDSLEFKEVAIKEYLNKSIGKFEQIYPVYSSKPVNSPSPVGRTSKPLFEWAREGRISEIDIPRHFVEIFDAEYVSRKTISKNELEKEIETKINLVKGDFRQKEILEKWREELSLTVIDSFVVDEVSVKVSSGFYVRQFVSDLAESYGTDAVTFSIKRVKIGEYTIA